MMIALMLILIIVILGNSYIAVQAEKTRTDGEVLQKLEDSVSNLINRGFVPIGGPQCNTHGVVKCYQAVMLKSKAGIRIPKEVGRID